MEYAADIIQVGKKITIKAHAYRKSKNFLMKKQDILTLTLMILSIIQAVVATYKAIEKVSYVLKYVEATLAILIASGSTYSLVAKFPETIARYEVASSMYIHVSSFFTNLYNGLSSRSLETTQLGMEYCRITISFLDGITNSFEDPENTFVEKNDPLFMKYQKQVIDLCGDHCKYLNAYKYTHEEYSKNLYFHILLEKDGAPYFCNNHVVLSAEDYRFSDNLLTSLQGAENVFKSWILRKQDYEKIYIICERSNAKTIFAVIVEQKKWTDADMKFINEQILEYPDILDSDIFNIDIYNKPECEVLIEV